MVASNWFSASRIVGRDGSECLRRDGTGAGGGTGVLGAGVLGAVGTFLRFFGGSGDVSSLSTSLPRASRLGSIFVGLSALGGDFTLEATDKEPPAVLVVLCVLR